MQWFVGDEEVYKIVDSTALLIACNTIKAITCATAAGLSASAGRLPISDQIVFERGNLLVNSLVSLILDPQLNSLSYASMQETDLAIFVCV